SIHHDHIHVQTDEVGGELKDAIVSARGVSLFDDEVSALNVTKRAQSIAEGIEFPLIWRSSSKKSNSGDLCRLLRKCRQRPRRRRAAEQSDELTATHPGNHSITSSASASSLSGTSRPSALAVVRLITNSSFVDCMTGRSAGFSPLRIRPT